MTIQMKNNILNTQTSDAAGCGRFVDDQFLVMQ